MNEKDCHNGVEGKEEVGKEEVRKGGKWFRMKQMKKTEVVFK